MITEVEKSRRARAVASSEGSLAMEGQTLDAVTSDLNRRYIEGEMTSEEFSAAVEKHVDELAAAMHEQALAISA